MTTVVIRPSELQVGHLIAHLGDTHRVVALEPSTHPVAGEGWIARCSDDWSIAVYRSQWGGVRVVDETPAGAAA